ncbi:MAG: MarR family winged helix-turn-helix transcriptional regulator [Jatrophihabitans sp.]|uniref:MarR family winged helix-turn-helix transcriptional regulator n=1 Tax=Jatrophihabitans sp. TaxID=1932789 RepID=UPI003F7F0FCE
MLTASRVLVGVSARSLAGTADSLTLPQFRTLVVLTRHGEMPLHRLAELLGVNSSSAMRMIDRLISVELAARREDPSNRRYTLVSATREGQAIVRKVMVRRRAELRRIVSRMPDERSEQLVAALLEFARASGEADETLDDEVAALGW